MRVSHMVAITPGRCGLYETTRELVTGLFKLGVDSRMVDPTKDKNKLHPSGDNDRCAPISDMDWATKADVIINHSGYDNTPIEKTKQPVIHIAHGRPGQSFCRKSREAHRFIRTGTTRPKTRALSVL